MSETQTERSQSSGTQSFPLQFVKRETGRTHTIDGGATTVPIVHGETGEPETEYVLLATVGGVDIPLATYNSGRIEVQVKAAQQSPPSPSTDS